MHVRALLASLEHDEAPTAALVAQQLPNITARALRWGPTARRGMVETDDLIMVGVAAVLTAVRTNNSGPYLEGAVRRAMVCELRKMAWHKERWGAPERLPYRPQPDPDGRGQAEARAQILWAFGRSRPREIELTLRTYGEGETLQEAARAVGLSAPQACTLRRRVRTRCL